MNSIERHRFLGEVTFTALNHYRNYGIPLDKKLEAPGRKYEIAMDVFGWSLDRIGSSLESAYKNSLIPEGRRVRVAEQLDLAIGALRTETPA